MDALEEVRFQQHFQRQVRTDEPDVVTIRDVKDVAIFQTMSPLTPEFLDLFHTRGIDRILRALIIYFQMFIQGSYVLLYILCLKNKSAKICLVLSYEVIEISYVPLFLQK